MIFVTGATGLLGRVIVLELLKKGKKVRASKRASSNLDEVKKSFKFYTEYPAFFFKKIEWVEVDFDDEKSIEIALRDVGEVYHCAGKISFDSKDDEEVYHAGVTATKNLLSACKASSVYKFLYVSSAAVMDLTNQYGMLTEQSLFDHQKDHSAYVISKYMCEQLVKSADSLRFRTVIVSPGMILGSGNWKQSSGELLQIFIDTPFTFSGGTSCVDVRDVAKISLLLMEQNVFGERFIISSENKKYTQIAHEIREKIGKKNSIVLTKKHLKCLIFLNILFGWLIAKLRLLTKANIDFVSSFPKASNKRIKEKLDYNFIPVAESIDFHIGNYIKDKNKNKQM